MARIVSLTLWAALTSAPALADGRISERVKTAIRERVDSGRIVGIVVGVIDADGRDYFAAKGDEAVFEEIRGLHAGGSFGSIIGRNAFQRPKADALKLLKTVMGIYAGKE